MKNAAFHVNSTTYTEYPDWAASMTDVRFFNEHI